MKNTPGNTILTPLKLLALTSVGVALASNTASAATIAGYLEGTNTFAATTSHADITASNFVNMLDFVTPIRSSFGDVDFNGAATNTFWFASNGNDDGTVSSSATVPTDHYLEFSMTVATGNTLDMSTMTFNWGYGSNDDGRTSDAGYDVYANVDGAGYALIDGDSIASALYNDGDFSSAGSPASIDISSLGTVDGGTIDFRLYAYSSNASPGGVIAFEQVQFNGDVNPIPEPGSAALLGLGGLALIFRRRK